MDPERRKAIEFFAKNAGYSVPPGRLACAKSLADAEAWGKARGLEFIWEDDWSVDHQKEYDCYDDGDPTSCEFCLCRDADGEVRTSLGCIDGATDEYRRVIEAELASEVMYLDARSNVQLELIEVMS